MADVRATKNGNWSDPTVWNTGALPTTADDVFTNTFTVNVNTSFEVLSLRNTSGTSITAGGTFNFNSGSISGSCTSATGIVPAATNLITVTAGSGTVTLSAPNTTVTGLSTGNTQIINYTGNCDFTITGISFNAAVGAFPRAYVINKSSNGNILITGNLTGGAANSSTNVDNHALFSTSGNTIVNGNVIGNLIGSSNGTHCGINQSVGNLTINGNVTGGGGASAGQIAVLFTGTNLTITGSITGGSTSLAVSTTGTAINISGSVVGGSGAGGLSISSAANINIIGPITAGSSTAAISSTGAHSFTYSGSLAASAASPAIISTSITATNIFTGPFYNNGATMAVQAARMFLSSNSTSWQFTSDAVGVSQSLFTADQIPTYPSASNVRLGTNYGSGSLTGTLAMPQASSVQFGVPVDSTTGSAVLTTASLASAIWDRQRSQLLTTGSIGERLQNVATPSIVGTQISSYLL